MIWWLITSTFGACPLETRRLAAIDHRYALYGCRISTELPRGLPLLPWPSWPVAEGSLILAYLFWIRSKVIEGRALCTGSDLSLFMSSLGWATWPNLVRGSSQKSKFWGLFNAKLPWGDLLPKLRFIIARVIGFLNSLIFVIARLR